MSIDTYTDPVAQLLNHGDHFKAADGSDLSYIEQFGLTTDNVPELIRMALDQQLSELDSDRLEVWAPVHAWRALAQLKAEAAINPLISLFSTSEDDWSIMDEMPEVFGQMGGIALPALSRYLADATQDEWARIIAANCILEIGEVDPTCREAAIAPLMQQLEHYADNGGNLNSTLIDTLVMLQAVEAAPLIEQAFGTGEIDEFLTGSWAHVQVELGLKQKSDFSEAELTATPPPRIAALRATIEQFQKTIEVRDHHTSKPAGFGSPKPTPTKKTNKKKKK